MPHRNSAAEGHLGVCRLPALPPAQAQTSQQWCCEGAPEADLETKSLDPLDAGQRNRRKRRQRRIPLWVRRVLRNRRTLITVLWVASATVKLVRIIKDLFDGS